MFQMFGFGGVPCPRCGHTSAGDSGYCSACGMSLGAPRNEPVLRENRWIPGPDELAVFFGVSALDGIFTKTLRVPATTRAYILQGEKATEVPQGEYEIEGFFTRLNHLLRDQHAEILITRTSALPVAFEFSELATCEHLKVTARFTVSVRVEQVPAFAQHFMTMPGVVSSANLRELLAPMVRQLAAEFIASQSLREMAGKRELRPQLDERLQSALKLALAQYGLAVVQVDTLSVSHDKFDANRARIGTLWLVTDEKHVELEHVRQLDQLYNDQEWQRIVREEQQARLRYRRAEMRQDESVERAELAVQEAERVHVIRAREIDLYGRVVEARNRREAIAGGAAETVAELEHALAKKGAAREDESIEWAHLRQLAQIRMRTEVEIAQQDMLEARQLAQQRFSHRLLQQQIENKVAQAMGIEDEARKRAELAQLHQHQMAVRAREHEIDDEQHQASLQSLALANAAHKREAQRVQEWEDELALDRKRKLVRADDEAQSLTQHEKLLRTIEADAAYSRKSQQLELDAEEKRQQLREDESEAQWQRELKRLELEREERYARWKSEYDSMQALGNMSDTGKVAVAATANAALLADYIKTQVHAGMRADQLQALAGVSPEKAAMQAQERVREERAHRDAEMDKDRRHQLDLLAMQNDVNKAALASHAKALVHARTCVNGHLVDAHAKFCPTCGVAL
ncbi:MAG: SPFH domain-containing protein [Pseudomonadota bacterium]